MKRKIAGAASHRTQKSQDIGIRRSTVKPLKAREERAPQLSPATLAFDINVPKGLKSILVNSRAQIKQGNLLVLPKEYKEYGSLPKEYKEYTVLEEEQKPPNVEEVFTDFASYYTNAKDKELESEEKKEALVAVITRGLLVYFEKTLGTNLLYVEERGQYAFLDNRYRSGVTATIDQEDDNSPFCHWYGADHLLRLLVKLPEILAQSSLDQYSIDLIGIYVKELLEWMDSKKDELFLPASLYRETPHWYQTDIRSRAQGGVQKPV
ncbi:Esa1p-associated factor [Serendipita sp. 405]|nr:Esa1p-associated factor [Serendipita sp. 405]